MYKKSFSSISMSTGLILVLLLLNACRTVPASDRPITEEIGETFPVGKIGVFGSKFDFWIYSIRDIKTTDKKVGKISIKGTRLETTEKAFGLTLTDTGGYEWDTVGSAELVEIREPGQKRRERTVFSYSFWARMEEPKSGVTRLLRAVYMPDDPNFDGAMRGTVVNENREIIFRFESNARLDTYKSPDKGLSVVSFYVKDTPVAVLDSRNGYEVTFLEGLQPDRRTQLASSVSTLFVLMKYGFL